MSDLTVENPVSSETSVLALSNINLIKANNICCMSYSFLI